MIVPHLQVGVILQQGCNLSDGEIDVYVHRLYKEVLCTSNDDLELLHQSILNDDDFISQIKHETPYELCMIRCKENIGDWVIHDYEEVDTSGAFDELPY